MILKGPTCMNGFDTRTSRGRRSARECPLTWWAEVKSSAPSHHAGALRDHPFNAHHHAAICLRDGSYLFSQFLSSGSAVAGLLPTSSWSMRLRIEKDLSRHCTFKDTNSTSTMFGINLRELHELSGKLFTLHARPSLKIYAGKSKKKQQGDQTSSGGAASPFANLASTRSSFDSRSSPSNGAAKTNGAANGAAKGNGATNGASHASGRSNTSRNGAATHQEPPRITNNLSTNLRLLKYVKEMERSSSKGSLQATSYRKKKTEKGKAETEDSVGSFDDFYVGDKEVGYESGQGQPVLLVDGYNVCGYWPKLKRHFARGDLETARMNLLVELATYGATRGVKVVCAFDAMFSGKPTTMEQFQGVDIVFTSCEADSWIEHEVSVLKENGCPRVWVATSDRAQGDFAWGKGAFVWSSSYLVSEIKAAKKDLKEELEDLDPERYSFQGKILEHNLDENTRNALYDLRSQLAKSERG